MTAVLMKVRFSRDIEVKGLGKKIEDARKADARSVETLAKAAGISRGYWYELERENIRDALPIATLRKVAEVLDIQLIGQEFSEDEILGIQFIDEELSGKKVDDDSPT